MINSQHISLLVIILIATVLFCNRETFTNIIYRPLDFTKNEQTGCSAPLLNDIPGGKFCNESIAKYYDMRKIKPNYNDYYEMLNFMMSLIGSGSIVESQLNESYNCNVADFEVVKLLNDKIASTIKNNSEFQHNGSFKYESITVIHPNLKYYRDTDGQEYIKALFSLYDTTRSASTEAFALIKVDKDTKCGGNLEIVYAGLVYPPLEINNEKKMETNKLTFTVPDALQNINLSNYVDVPDDFTVKGGISNKINSLIDEYFKVNPSS